MNKRRARPIIAIAFATGLVAFGLCAHRPGLLVPRVVGIVVAAIVLFLAMVWSRQPAEMLGLKKIPARRLPWLPVVVGFGVGLAMYYRYRLGLSLLPGELKKFCLLAASIGLCEELAYRGFLQGLLAKYGQALACVLAALAHTAYKCSLFVFPDVPVRADILWLAIGTFLAGLVFGLMREKLNSVLFPALAHIAFDVVTYGDLANAPWWVW